MQIKGNNTFRRGLRPMRITTTICIALVLAVLWTGTSSAQEMAVPINIQVPLFLKILTFDRNLKDRVGDEIVIAVLYQEKFRRSLNVKDEFIKLMNELPVKSVEDIPIRCVSLDISDEIELDSVIARYNADVLYIAPLRAVSAKTIAGVSRAKKKPTLTGVPDYVESGLAVGIGIKGDKPQIIINLPAVKAEGVDFSSQLLKLAKVLS